MSERTTVTLDEDVSALLEQEAQRKGLPADEVVNDVVRRVLKSRKPFVVHALDLGPPKIDITCSSAALTAFDELDTDKALRK